MAIIGAILPIIFKFLREGCREGEINYQNRGGGHLPSTSVVSVWPQSSKMLNFPSNCTYNRGNFFDSFALQGSVYNFFLTLGKRALYMQFELKFKTFGRGGGQQTLKNVEFSSNWAYKEGVSRFYSLYCRVNLTQSPQKLNVSSNYTFSTFYPPGGHI